MSYNYIISLTFLVIVCTSDLLGESTNITPPDQDISILEEIDILPSAGLDLSLQDVRHQSFLPYDIWKNQVPSGEGYWGKFHLVNQGPSNQTERSWIVKFPIVWTHITCYAVYNNGDILESKTGQFLPISLRTHTPSIKSNITQIFLQPNEEVTVYFKVRSTRLGSAPKFNIDIISTNFYNQRAKNKKLYQGLFIGFMLMMLTYNILLYLFTDRDDAYLHYSLYILGIILYSAYNSGDLADIFQPLFFPDHPKYAYLGKTSTYLIICSYLLFLRSFLQLETLLPRWNKILSGLLMINFVACLLDVALMLGTNFNPDISDIVTVSNAIVFITFIFLLSYKLYNTESRYRLFIIGGIVLMGIGATGTTIARINGVNYSTLSFQIGTILEIIIFSFGLAYKRRHIEEEKHAAIFELEKTELLRAQEQKETENLRSLEMYKSELYANITHEFRTPLTIINGNLEFINGFNREKEVIKRNSDKMLRLVNQILDLSKIESETTEIKVTEEDASLFVQQITETFQTLAANQQVDVRFNSTPQKIVVFFDKEKLEHIVDNLLSNALKFTEAGGTVDVTLHTIINNGEEFLQLVVADTGLGIREERLSRIFDRYHTSQNQNEIGWGLGLSFVKELVQALQGDISVKSAAKKGSTFTVTLPTVYSPPLQQSSTQDSIPSYPTLEESQVSPVTPNEKPVLLLIEDSEDIILYMQKILADQYHLHFALDGETGYTKALELLPDIIVSDIMMPKKDGYQLTRDLKENFKTSHIPILLLTAKSTQKDINRGFSIGADAYLIKPFNKEELMMRLSNISRHQKILIDKIKKGLFNNKPVNPTDQPTAKEHKFLKIVEDLVRDHLDNSDYNTEAICTSIGLSKKQLYRKVKALTGQTPLYFIRDIRLDAGRELLQNSDLNVSEIAYRVGFEDPNYFTRVFQKKYGVTPSKFSATN